MKTLSCVAATTGLDRSGNRISREKLEALAAEAGRIYFPQMWQHNPMHPPIGRVARSELREGPDGELHLILEAEIFVDGDTPESTKGDGRIIPIADHVPPLYLEFGEEFDTDVGLELRAELEGIGSKSQQRVHRKAFEPISILLLGLGTFLVGKVAEGFLKEIGADGYKALKKALSEYPGRRSAGQDLIYDFTFVVQRGGGPVQVHYLLQNPTATEVAEAFDRNFTKLDDAILNAMERQPDAKIIVFGHGVEDPDLLYSVREDGVPFGPDGGILVCQWEIREGMGVSIGFR